MKAYMKPDVFVTEFQVNEAIAACDRVVTGSTTVTTYPAQTVTCEIGGQTERIFSAGTSGCATAASQYALGYYENVYYICWYSPTEVGGGRPSDEQKALMAAISGVRDPQGWHYCAVASEDISTDILGFSY